MFFVAVNYLQAYYLGFNWEHFFAEFDYLKVLTPDPKYQMRIFTDLIARER